MIFGYTIMIIAIVISAIAAWYSVAGLTAIFAAAVTPVIIMGGALEAGKIVATVWLHNNWKRAGWAFKTYLVPAIVFLMLLTSMGIFGFLSKAHSDQSLVSGDAISKVAIYDEKIKTLKDNVESAKRALQQMDAQVDARLSRGESESGAERAVSIRKQQAKERAELQREISASQKEIIKLQEERAPLAAEFRKVEAEVGPIKYIAALIYGDNPDQNILERAVRWVIILIVIVFDPLALCLILAANKQLEWARQGVGGWIHDEEEKTDRRGESKDESHTANAGDGNLQPQIEPIATEEEFFDRARYAAQVADIMDEQHRAEAANNVMSTIEKSEELNIPVLENEEMWAQRVIDENKNEEMASDMVELNQPQYEPDDGQLSKEQIEQIKQSTKDEQSVEVARNLEDKPPPIVEEKPIDEFNIPIRRGNDFAVRYQGKIYNLDAFSKLYPNMAIQADNDKKESENNYGFGDKFPPSPVKGDMFIRTDYFPDRLFKWNGKKWIETDKNSTDSYAYNEAYVQHLISKLQAGEYEIEDLSDAEREQVEKQIEQIVKSNNA